MKIYNDFSKTTQFSFLLQPESVTSYTPTHLVDAILELSCLIVIPSFLMSELRCNYLCSLWNDEWILNLVCSFM